MITKLLTINEWSRPKRPLESIKGLVIHWVGNPQTDANANWRYFEYRKGGTAGYGSAHYIVGLEGEVLHCIPDNEMAYHVGADKYTDYALAKYGTYPNNCTIGIETCHLDWEGNYSTKTLEELAGLITNLCDIYKLHPIRDVTTHNAITGKDCPRFFVNRPIAWDWFKYAIAGKCHHQEG